MTLVHQTDARTAARLAGPEIVHLNDVDGCIVYDLPDAQTHGGGTRLAADISTQEVALLARAMTYKLAAVGLRVGGAKIGVRAQAHEREEVLERFRAEVAPLLACGQLLTGPDLGTTVADFGDLPLAGGSDGIATRMIEGVPGEEYLTGFAAAVAIEAALGSSAGALAGRSVALEGFGKIGSGVAREVARRGGRIVAVSTIEGCAVALPGSELPVARLLEARATWGDALVHHIGVPVRPLEALWRVDADVLVPGARAAVVDASRAATIRARAIVPIANAPYTASALEILAARGIPAHADFVASAGGAIAYLHPDVATATSTAVALDAVERQMVRNVRDAMSAAVTPYTGAVAVARSFLRSWRPPDTPLPTPPLAGT